MMHRCDVTSAVSSRNLVWPHTWVIGSLKIKKRMHVRRKLSTFKYYFTFYLFSAPIKAFCLPPSCPGVSLTPPFVNVVHPVTAVSLSLALQLPDRLCPRIHLHKSFRLAQRFSLFAPILWKNKTYHMPVYAQKILMQIHYLNTEMILPQPPIKVNCDCHDMRRTVFSFKHESIFVLFLLLLPRRAN